MDPITENEGGQCTKSYTSSSVTGSAESTSWAISTPQSPPGKAAFRAAVSTPTARLFSGTVERRTSRRHDRRTRRRSQMTKPTRDETQSRALSKDEVESQVGEALPDREQMSLINANVAAPINLALAANVLSDNSIAYADATQTAPITQTN